VFGVWCLVFGVWCWPLAFGVWEGYMELVGHEIGSIEPQKKGGSNEPNTKRQTPNNYTNAQPQTIALIAF
jgi:hypothetical protein